MTGWALAATQPNVEDHVAEALRKAQLSCHLFKLRKNVVHKGAVIERLVPAFPRYIFVSVGNHWRMVREIYGVAGFVKFGSADPELVDERIIDGLVAQTIDDVFPSTTVTTSSRFHSGQRVIIAGIGPAAGHVGIYQHPIDAGRACLLFDWMGRWCPVEVDERDLSEEMQDEKRTRLGKRRRRSKRR